MTRVTFPVKNNVLLGIRFRTVTQNFDRNPNLPHPLNEVVTDDLTYSDGEDYTGFNFGAFALNGECQYLKDTNAYEVRDSRCSAKRSFICLWKSKKVKSKRFATVQMTYFLKGRLVNLDFSTLGPRENLPYVWEIHRT